MCFGSRSFHVGDADLVASTLLGGVQRLVGAVDELREQRRLTGRCESDADRELQPTGESGGRDLGANALSQCACPGLGGLVEDERELLASVTSAHVGFARTGFQDLGQLCEHGIAVQMSVRVIDLLEVVEVDHEKRDRVVVAPRPLHLLQELLGEGAPVGQLRQLVRERVLLLGLEQLRVADGDRSLRGDAVEEVGLILRQLPPGVEVELHRAHQLS